MFFDLNVKGNSFENNLKLAGEALKYGWNHINFSYNPDNYSNALKFKKELEGELDDGITVDYTLEIKSNNNHQ